MAGEYRGQRRIVVSTPEPSVLAWARRWQKVQIHGRRIGAYVMSTAISRTMKSMLMATVALTGVALAPKAFAQSASTEAEKVTVTGSRIKQKGLVSASPITTVSDTAIRNQGSPNITSVLNNLPAVNFAQDNSVGALSDGTATVDLRSQGASRTLVLIDGRRVMPGDPLQGSPAADLNLIPAAMVQRVEVVTGGQSAIYGSDAMAGVVNFVMKKDFEGIRLDVTGGATQSGNDDALAIKRLKDASFPVPEKDIFDGQQVSVDLMVGANTADGRGNITAYAGYQNIDQIRGDARAGTACGYDDDGADLICLASSNFGRIIPLSGSGAANDADVFIGNSNWVDFTGAPSQTFNFAALNLLQRPNTRYKAGAFFHYDVNESIEAYGSVMYFKDTSNVRVAPSGSFLQTGSFKMNCDNPLMTNQQAAAVGCTNTFGNAGSGRLTSDVTVLLGRRNVEGGVRDTIYDHDQFRFVGGLRGAIASGWDYDLFGQYSETGYTQVYFGDWSPSRKEKALNVNPLTGNCKSFDNGTDLNCVPLNIFGGFGGITADMLRYVSVSPIITGKMTQTVLGGSVTGDLGQHGVKSPYADGGVQVAGGYEYRRDSLSFNPSSEWQAADLEGSSTKYERTNAALDVLEAFAEIDIPLVENRPFFYDLSLNGGYRISDYSTQAGIIHTYKYGAEWAPSQDLRFRGGFQVATRAPGLLELFGPAGFGLTNGFTDFCGDPTNPTRPAFAAGCNNVGLSLAQYNAGVVDCISGQCSTITGSNPALKPEESESVTLGLILTPTFLKQFSLSVDYWNIEINDYIGTLSASVIYNQCVQTGNPFFCSKIVRDPAGSLLVKGFGLDQSNVNAGSQTAEGIDIESNFRQDLDSYGSLNLSLIGTYQLKQEIVDVAAGQIGKRDCVGYFGITCGTPYFEWRHNLRTTWVTPWDLELSATWRHLSSVLNDSNATDPNLKNGNPTVITSSKAIDAYDYLDIAGNFAINENYEVSFGMTNVFDKDPPYLDQDYVAGNALNTLNANYDSVGRYMFITGTAKF